MFSSLDILPPINRGIPKTHNLGFCFFLSLGFRNCLRSQGAFGLMLAPQTNPASPAVLMYRISNKILVCFDSRECQDCPVLFPRSTTFSSPLQLFANFVVRVYVSRVAGGSMTDLNISRYCLPQFILSVNRGSSCG